jgi:hypothetical protein
MSSDTAIAAQAVERFHGQLAAGQDDAIYDAADPAYRQAVTRVRIPGQGGRDSEIDPVSIPKLIRSRFRDESGH